MLQIIIWFFAILFSLHIYLKILNIADIGFAKLIGGVLFSGGVSFGVYSLHTYMPFVKFIFMVLLIGAFAGFITHTRLDLTLAGGIISFGISYGFGIISTAIMQSFVYLITGSDNDLIVTLLSVPLQFVFITVLFSVTRLKKGILFLKEKGAGVVGLIISGIVFASIILIPNQNIPFEIRLILVISVILCVAGIIVWWRRGLTKLYRERIGERAMNELEAENAKLRESNEYLSTMTHRDSKLIAALYDRSAANGRLPQQIEELMRDRMSVLLQSQQVYKALPETNNELLDGVISSMLTRATEEGIQFDITLIGGISELIEMVTPLKFNTLCADLIENAIIATSYSEFKRILILIGSNDGIYELTISDSGIPFEKETLTKLGQERASTHLDEGGSGIGYMEIFKILREHKASLIIAEHPPKKFGFTKTVKVRFDGRDEYIVQEITDG